jgi:protein-L-isoaspartate(D-aspartate) O-methyltransferase
LEEDFAALRNQMVEKHILSRGIKDSATIKSLLAVPREEFVPLALRRHAYDDSPLPIGEGQTISQPYIVALMTSSIQLSPYDTILEIGTGSGYQAAILSRIVKKVYTIERIPELGEHASNLFKELGFSNIEVKIGDGTLGWKEKGPFDAIIVTAGAPQVPQYLKDQVKVGGRIVIPVGDTLSQRLLLLHKVSEQEWREQVLESVRFVPLIGDQGW